MNKPLTGSEQRLRDIQDALAEKVAAERRPFGHIKQNIPQATPKIRVKSLRGREQRLREIQNALDSLEAGSKTTPTSATVSTLSTAKRPSESSPSPPAAKRRRLQSSQEAVAIVLPTSILPTPAPTTIQPTNHASASPKIFEQQPEELYEKVRHRAVEAPQPRDADSHIREFFAKYPDFSYNPRTSVTDEFRRMCGFLRWKHSKEVGCVKAEGADWGYKDARQEFNDAMAQEFNYIYGTDLEDINSWKNLCKALGIIPIPKGLEECQDAVAATHVNIVDLVETRITGKPVKLFESEEALSAYTVSERKFFPRDNAYAGGLLRFLLRHILNP